MGSMIVERARVESLEQTPAGAGRVVVSALSKQGCKLCDEGRGCGGGVFARLAVRAGPERRAVIAANPDDLALQVGDEVMLGLRDSALVTGALLIYGLPLLGLFVAATGAFQFGDSDLLVALAGLLGLAGGFLVGARLAPADSERFQPVVLRKAGQRPCDAGLSARFAASSSSSSMSGTEAADTQSSLGYRA